MPNDVGHVYGFDKRAATRDALRRTGLPGREPASGAGEKDSALRRGEHRRVAGKKTTGCGEGIHRSPLGKKQQAVTRGLHDSPLGRGQRSQRRDGALGRWERGGGTRGNSEGGNGNESHWRGRRGNRVPPACGYCSERAKSPLSNFSDLRGSGPQFCVSSENAVSEVDRDSDSL